MITGIIERIFWLTGLCFWAFLTYHAIKLNHILAGGFSLTMSIVCLTGTIYGDEGVLD